MDRIRDRNSSRGTSGSAARRSTMTKAPSSARSDGQARPTTVGEVHPRSAAPRAPWTRATTAPVMAAAPRQSNRRRVPTGALEHRVTGQGDRGDGDRHGDEEDRRPAEGAGEQSAEHDTGRSAERRRGAPDAHGPGSRLTGEGQQEQRHRGGAEGGGAGALDDAARRRAAPASAARGRQQGAGGEQGRAGDEHAAAAEQVCGAPGQQQQAAEREDVGVDDPGERRWR